MDHASSTSANGDALAAAPTVLATSISAALPEPKGGEISFEDVTVESPSCDASAIPVLPTNETAHTAASEIQRCDLTDPDADPPEPPIPSQPEPVPSIPGAHLASSDHNVYVKHFRFNQDGSCFAAATTKGFRVYTCSPLSEFGRRESDFKSRDGSTSCGEGEANNSQETNLVAMLYRSHSFAFVTRSEPRKVQLWNDKERRVVGSIRCRYTIRNVLLGREIIVIVTGTAVYIYLAGTISPIHVFATAANPNGVCAISTEAAMAPWRVACPTLTPGLLRIQSSERADGQKSLLIQAHQNSLDCVALAPDGSAAGTASIRGTVIRIHSTITGGNLYELRLSTVPKCVRCITFRHDGRFVAVASSSPTIHIFRLQKSEETLGSSAGAIAVPEQPASAVSVVEGNARKGSTDSLVVAWPTGRFVDEADEPSSTHTPDSPAKSLGPSAIQGKSSPFSMGAVVDAGGALASMTASLLFQGKSLVQDAVKTVLPRYFAPSRSFAQLALPVDEDLDVRVCAIASRCGGAQAMPIFYSTAEALEESPIPATTGPICCFTGAHSNHFFVLHHDGFFYEARFNSQDGGPCKLLSATPWFAPRDDFQLKISVGQSVTDANWSVRAAGNVGVSGGGQLATF